MSEARAHLARTIPLAGLCLGIVALGLQAALTIPASMRNGMSLAGAVIYYLSFFTVISNALAVACYGARLLPSNSAPARFLRAPQTVGAVAIYLLMVELNYALLLQASWSPVGLMKAADVLLHYVAPNLFLIHWALGVPKGRTSVRHLRAWLLLPLAYVAYVLARGALTGYYPYSFLDVVSEGSNAVLRNVAILFGVFVALSGILIGLDRWLGGRTPLAAKGAD